VPPPATETASTAAWTAAVSSWAACTLDTLAAAYAEAGRFAEAVQAARQALILATEPLAAELKARIALYEDQRPFRDTQ